MNKKIIKGVESSVSLEEILELLEYKIAEGTKGMDYTDEEYGIYLPFAYKGEEALNSRKYRSKLKNWYRNNRKWIRRNS